MQYFVPFQLRNKENIIVVEYEKIKDAKESGFEALAVPFDIDKCIGYPMIHAYFDNMSLNGYERYCGWIQIVRREEYNTINQEKIVTTIYDVDMCEALRELMKEEFEEEIKYAEERGKDAGRIEGRLEGKFEGKLEIAKKMIASNKMSAEDIAEYSGMPIEQIRELQYQKDAKGNV